MLISAYVPKVCFKKTNKIYVYESTSLTEILNPLISFFFFKNRMVKEEQTRPWTKLNAETREEYHGYPRLKQDHLSACSEKG